MRADLLSHVTPTTITPRKRHYTPRVDRDKPHAAGGCGTVTGRVGAQNFTGGNTMTVTAYAICAG